MHKNRGDLPWTSTSFLRRVKNILLSRKTEWPVIAEEPATVADVYKNYLVFVVAIPAIIGLLMALAWGFAGLDRFVIVQYS